MRALLKQENQLTRSCNCDKSFLMTDMASASFMYSDMRSSYWLLLTTGPRTGVNTLSSNSVPLSLPVQERIIYLENEAKSYKDEHIKSLAIQHPIKAKYMC